MRRKVAVLAGSSLLWACVGHAGAFDADLGTLVQSPRIEARTTQLELQGDRSRFDAAANAPSGAVYAIQGRLSHALNSRVQLRGSLGHAGDDDDHVTAEGVGIKVGLPASRREAFALLLGAGHSEITSSTRSTVRYVRFDSVLIVDSVVTIHKVREDVQSYDATLAWSSSLADSFTALLTVVAGLNQSRGSHAYAGLNAAGLSWTHGAVRLLAEAALLSPNARRMLAVHAAYAPNGWLQVGVDGARDFDQRWNRLGLGLALRRKP